MREFQLQFAEPSTVNEQTAKGGLCWLADKDSTIKASLANLGHLGPSLGRVGEVADPNVDFVRIAVAVYAADRSVPRQEWRIELEPALDQGHRARRRSLPMGSLGFRVGGGRKSPDG